MLVETHKFNIFAVVVMSSWKDSTVRQSAGQQASCASFKCTCRPTLLFSIVAEECVRLLILVSCTSKSLPLAHQQPKLPLLCWRRSDHAMPLFVTTCFATEQLYLQVPDHAAKTYELFQGFAVYRATGVTVVGMTAHLGTPAAATAAPPCPKTVNGLT